MKLWFWIAVLTTFAYSISLVLNFFWGEDVLFFCSVVKFGVWDLFCRNEDALLFSLSIFGAVAYSLLTIFLLIRFRISTALSSFSRVLNLGFKSSLLFVVSFFLLAVFMAAFWCGWLDYEYYSGYAGIKFLWFMLAINCYFCAFIFLGFTREKS